MAKIRGRPLVWLVVLLSAWAGGRVLWAMMQQDHGSAGQMASSTLAPIAMALPESLPTRLAPAQSTLVERFAPVAPSGRLPNGRLPNFRPPPALDPWQDGGRPSGLPLPALVAGGGEPLSTGRDTPPSNALAPVGKAGQPFHKRRWGGEVYAYSFWRFGSGGGDALAPSAQYGGSQTGLVATLDSFGETEHGLTVLLRGSATPDGDERELALGFRWTPDSDWPLALSAERRFRTGAPDRFATYLAGGVDGIRFAGKWKVDAYGQVGYATGRGGGGFFDAQARALHPMAKLGGVPLSIGAGGWAGGQKGAARLDAGPTLQAQIDTGLAKFKLQLDWRQRLAGNALAKNGVALTVSTGL